LEIVDNGRIVLAGGGRDLDGYLNMWDLRNVSGNTALNFSAAPNKHHHLKRLCLKREMGKVHGLIDEAHFIPCTYPEFLRPDPLSCDRVAVHMRCGWSAVLDIARLGMLHVHAPPAKNAPSDTWMDAMQEMDEAVFSRIAGDSGRVALPREFAGDPRRHSEIDSQQGGRIRDDKDVVGGCWLGDSFVVPSATMGGTVFIVDFGGSYGLDDAESLDDSIIPPSAVQVRVSHDSTGVVRIPGGQGDALLSYGADSTFNVLTRF
jgi:hypothetical protein